MLIDIEQGNKLIAEFMGCKVVGEDSYDIDNPRLNAWPQSWLHYHDKWDWLMPVVEKIVNAACELPTIELRKEARKRHELIEDQLVNFRIKGVHGYSVQFIQWYNQTQNME